MHGISREQIEDMIVVTAFLDMLRTRGSIPQGMSAAEAFDNLRELEVIAPNSDDDRWHVRVGGGSGTLALFSARGTVKFFGDALQSAVRRVTSLASPVVIPAGTMVTVEDEGHLTYDQLPE